MTWQVDNKNWMKERRDSWKPIAARLKSTNLLPVKQINQLKKWYLTGEFTPDAKEIKRSSYIQDPQHPIWHYLKWSELLIELWLTPNQSNDNLNRTLVDYTTDERSKTNKAYAEANPHYLYDARHRFLEVCLDTRPYSAEGEWLYHCAEGESFFMGLEEKLYNILFRSDYIAEKFGEQCLDLKKTSDLDAERSYEICAQILSDTNIYFETLPPLKNHISQYRMDELKDALRNINKQLYMGEWVVGLIKTIDRINKQPELFPPEFYFFAKDLANVLDDNSLPEHVKKDIDLMRSIEDSIEQQIAPGAIASFYMQLNSKKDMIDFLPMLNPQKRYESSFAGDLYSSMSRMNKPEHLTTNENDLLMTFKLGPMGDSDMDNIFWAASILNVNNVYAFFEKPGNPLTFYQIPVEEQEYEDPINGANIFTCHHTPVPIYEVGQDRNLDQYLNEKFKNYHNALPEIVKRFQS